MGVSLFSSRIIIDALGVENYGIYTIVGGFISLFAVFLGSLDSAASRFFAFEIGKGQGANLKIVFRTSLFTHVFYAIVVALLLEVLGIYFLKYKGIQYLIENYEIEHTLSKADTLDALTCITHKNGGNYT